MFLDDVVIAGLLAVGGTLVFFIGVGIFIYQDMHKNKKSS